MRVKNMDNKTMFVRFVACVVGWLVSLLCLLVGQLVSQLVVFDVYDETLRAKYPALSYTGDCRDPGCDTYQKDKVCSGHCDRCLGLLLCTADMQVNSWCHIMEILCLYCCFRNQQNLLCLFMQSCHWKLCMFFARHAAFINALK